MVVFGEINSFSRAVIFTIVGTICFVGFILLGFTICSFFGVNQLIGVILGMSISVALLWFVYDQWGYDLLSSKKRYHFVKK